MEVSLSDIRFNPAYFEICENQRVRIWSGEHHLYWGPDRCGYTPDGLKAGIYDFSDAYEATQHCGPDKRISYRIVEESGNNRCFLCPLLIALMNRSNRIKQIQKETAQAFGISVLDLKSSSRKKNIVTARGAAMKRCRKETDLTLEEIGKFFNRNHSTVLHNIKRI